MTKSDIIVNVEDGTIISELTSTLAAPAQSFVFGDVLDMQVTGVVPNEGSDSADRPWSIIDMTARDFRVALGTADRSPFTGAFTVNASSSIPYNATQAEMQTALNNDATIASEGGVIVSALSSSGWKVNFNTVGAKTALAGAENSMLPSSSIYTDLLRAGDGSTTEVWMIRVETAPSAYAELTDAITAPVISVDQIRNGDAGSGVSEVQAFVMQGVGVSGTFALVLDGVATGEIAFDADSISITEAIEKHPIITGDDLVSVTGNAKDFTVSFDSSLGDLSSLTVDSSNLIGLNGKSGEFSLNTNEIIELLNGANTAPAIFEIVLYDTDNSQGKTIHQSTVDIKQDIIPDSPPSVTPIVQYALASHTHAIGDVTNLQTELDDKATAADVDAIEARDWVEVTSNSIDSALPESSWEDGRLSIMSVNVGISLGYPEDDGSVEVDKRSLDIPAFDTFYTRTFKTTGLDGGNVYTSVRAGANWTTWVKTITSDAGVISDALTFSGQLEATGQSFVDGDSVITGDLGDARWSSKEVAYRGACTGIIESNGVTINGDNVSVDIGEVVAQFIDNTTDEVNPTRVTLTKAASTQVAPPNLLTSTVSFLGLDSAGDYVWQGTAFTRADTRDIAIIAVVVHTNFTTIDRISYRPISCIGTTDMARDLMNVLQPRNESGNVFSANGTNLNLDKTLGGIMATDINYQNNRKDPHVAVVDAATVVEDMLLVYSDGTNEAASGTNEINVDPDWYEDTSTPGISNKLAVASNKWTNQLVVIFQDGRTNIQVGQFLYGNKADALVGINTDNYVVAPVIESLAVKRAWLTVKGTETDLTSVDTEFTPI